MSSTHLDADLARVREFFDSDAEQGQDKVSIWTPRISLTAEYKTNLVKGTDAWDYSIKVRTDDEVEAVRIMDWLRDEMTARFGAPKGPAHE